ncbi:MAG: hypothetical protein CH6_2951 [Candidatus Kapaibacterium sp.]|nr:MAG: hypothetical protein CH6_2951 [Candidatus Kapabacteria bacterium]
MTCNIKKLLLFSILTLFLVSCLNPFAPKLVETSRPESILTDQKSPEGVFQNFRYAYNFKDTVVYSKLLADEFVFVYRNYDIGVDRSWGKSEDVKATYGLFQAVNYIELIWNDTYIAIGDSLEKNIQRGFSLTIVFSTNDVVRLQGKGNFKLKFNPIDSIWQITYWRDDTYF